MTGVGKLDGAIGAGSAQWPRAALPGQGFAVSAETPRPAAAGPTWAAAPASLSGLLALQETGVEAPRDRAARRRGQDILAVLSALQRALLAGADPADTLEQLAALTADLPRALDPRLDAVLSAIALRGRVEVARRQHDSDAGRYGAGMGIRE